MRAEISENIKVFCSIINSVRSLSKIKLSNISRDKYAFKIIFSI